MDRKAKFAVIGTVVAVLLIAGAITWKMIQAAAPSTERLLLTEYYQVPEGEMLVLLDDAVYEKNALLIDGAVYLDLELVQEMNYRFYWDTDEKLLIYTTSTEIYKAYAGENRYYINNATTASEHPPVIKNDTGNYVSMEYALPFLNLTYQIYRDPDRLVIQYTGNDYLYATVLKDTELRVSYDSKSAILADVKKDDRVMFVDAGGIQENGYLKVMTADGIRGYIKAKTISDSFYASVGNQKEEVEYPHILRESSVNLVWHMTVNTDANAYFTDLYAPTKGLTVIAPTWFNVNSESGTLDSRADLDYVAKAHDLGLELWAVFSNFHPNSTDAVEIDDYELLSNSKNRETLVNGIIEAVQQYDLDGVNIDFELIKLDEGPHFIQFLRELSVQCRLKNIILSVDNYVPASYNAYYNLTEQGKLVDYVIIMGYDEHYDGSSEAGSVSSIGFVTKATEDTLKMVPSEQIIMAIPFYTRLWKEITMADGSIALSSEALGMEAVNRLLRENEVVTAWQSEAGQFYGEYHQGDVRCRIWVEDAMSIEEKMKVISNNNLAGVAEWRLGFEQSSIWSIIQSYLH